jgi:hypothetical protein
MSSGMRSDRRGFGVLPWILCVCMILFVVAVSGSAQVSSTRRMVDNIQLRRLMEFAAASAFEEACAAIETKVPSAPFPPKGQPRPISLDQFSRPMDLELKETPADFAEAKLKATPVSARLSPWKRAEGTDENGVLRELEVAVVELKVGLKMKTAGGAVARNFRARRYATLRPNGRNSALKFHILPHNLTLDMEESK